jgi:phosphatidate cytidylyltransferase
MKSTLIHKFSSFQLQSRILIALFGVPLLIGSAFLDSYAFLIFWTLIWIFVVLELASLIQLKEQKKYLFILSASVLYVVLIHFSQSSHMAWFFSFTWLFFPLFIWLIIKLTKAHSLLLYLAYLAYVTFPMFFLFTIFQKQGPYAILLILFTVWAMDTFSYFTGIVFGKHPIAPKLSPKKTIEGTLGGIIGASILFIILLQYFKLPHYGFNPYLWALLLTVSAFTGDLLESYLKRQFDKKDSGKILLGHGGMLDRFDSFLFLVYAYAIVLIL